MDKKIGTKSGKIDARKLQENVTYLRKQESLSDKEYARSTAKKRASIRKGEQHSKQPDDVAKKNEI